MRPCAPITRDLVLVGGGHAQTVVSRPSGTRPLPGARLTPVRLAGRPPVDFAIASINAGMLSGVGAVARAEPGEAQLTVRAPWTPGDV